MSLAEKMRDRLNSRVGKEVAKTLTKDESLLHVADWIEMPEYFQRGMGGKGFPQGHITQVVGESDTGKTTLIMEGMISCQKSGGVVYLIDAEHKFSMPRFRLMGGDPEQIIVIQVDSLQEGWNSVNEICKDLKSLREEGDDVKSMVVWDSIVGSPPEGMIDADANDSHVALEAKVNNKEVRKNRKLVKDSNTALVIINHWYMTMPTFGISKKVTKGGTELYFFSTLIIETKRRAWLKRTFSGDDDKFGLQGTFEVMKGHVGGKTSTTFFIVPQGVLPSKEELEEYKGFLKGKSPEKIRSLSLAELRGE